SSFGRIEAAEGPLGDHQQLQMSASALSTFLKQDLLEDEVTELLGERSRSGGRRWMRSRDTATATAVPRRLSMTAGTIAVRRPRVRGLEARFESRVLPLFKRRTEELGSSCRSSTFMAWPKATSSLRFGASSPVS